MEIDKTTRRHFLELSAAAMTLALSPAAESSSPSQSTTAPAGATSKINLTALTLAGATAQIRQKQLSPVELTHAVLDRIHALNPKIGAFITVMSERAQQAAGVAE